MDTASDAGHLPVMLAEVLALAAPRAGAVIVDATLGAGGYTRSLLEIVGPAGRLLALDWDKAAIEQLLQSAESESLLDEAIGSKRLILAHQPYSQIAGALEETGWGLADGIVADLGLSSLQLDDPKRGLSFQVDGPLDMRLNSRETVTATDIINQWSETSLAELFQTYGDEGEAGRIAAAIVAERRRAPLLRTTALAELIAHHVVPARRRGRIHPATRVFQALRIAVNSERQELERFLASAWTALRPGGRLIIVAFHSGEDSLVKERFRAWDRSGEGKLLSKKALQPSALEIKRNPRARSARLRGIEKT